MIGSGEWPVWVMSNHDRMRAYSRFADGKHDDDIAKVMAAMYLLLRGTPIMYYGEEIGMKNNEPTRKEDVKDPIGQLGWPTEKGRDGERTPMQWNDTPNAGFTTGNSVAAGSDDVPDAQCASRAKGSEFGLEFLQDRVDAASYEQGAAGWRLRCA